MVSYPDTVADYNQAFMANQSFPGMRAGIRGGKLVTATTTRTLFQPGTDRISFFSRHVSTNTSTNLAAYFE